MEISRSVSDRSNDDIQQIRKKSVKREETYDRVISHCREEESDEDNGETETTRRHFLAFRWWFTDLGQKEMAMIGIYTAPVGREREREDNIIIT